jgi:hypothetical protein
MAPPLCGWATWCWRIPPRRRKRIFLKFAIAGEIGKLIQPFLGEGATMVALQFSPLAGCALVGLALALHAAPSAC